MITPNATMYLMPNENGVSFEWESFDKFVSDLPYFKQRGITPQSVCRDSHSGDWEQWLGDASGPAGVLQKIEYGWPALRDKLEKKLADIELVIPSLPNRALTRRRKRIHADHGDEVDMGRVWGGDLDHAWILPKRKDHIAVDVRRVTMVVDVTSAAFVNSEAALWRAALAVKLYDALIRMGRTLEVWVQDSTGFPFSTYGAPQNLWSAWCVKKTNETLLLDRLASMTNIGMLRIVGFMAEHANSDWEVVYSYGRALNRGLTHTLLERQKNGELILKIGECYNRDATKREYQSAIAQLEIQAGLPHQETAA